MNKVIKISFSVVSALVLTALIIPVLLLVLLSLEPVQNFAVRRAAVIFGDYLGTTVTIDRINVGLFNRVMVEGFYAEDHEGDTLIYAQKVNASIAGFGLRGGRFTLSHLDLRDGWLRMKQYPDSTTNLSRVLEPLKNRREDRKGLRVIVKRLNVEDTRFSYRKNVVRERPSGINFDDLELTCINISMRDVVVRKHTAWTEIEHLSLKDKSGLEIKALSGGNIRISETGILIDDFRFTDPYSSLAMDHVNLTYGEWPAFRNFVEEVNIDTRIRNSSLNIKTLANFVPALSGNDLVIHIPDVRVDGKVPAFIASFDGLSADGTRLDMNMEVEGLPDIQNTDFVVRVDKVTSSGDAVYQLIDRFADRPEGDARLGEWLSRVGDFSMNGNFSGNFHSFEAVTYIFSDVGDVELSGMIKPGEGSTSVFSGSLRLADVDVGRLASGDNIGHLTLAGEVEGILGSDDLELLVDVAVGGFDFNGHTYTDIFLDGYLFNKQFQGNIESNDPDISFDFDGMIDLNDSVPAFDFSLDLYLADLHKLNFNKRDSVSIITASLSAVGTGSDPDNLNGTVTIDQLEYMNPVDTVRAQGIVIRGNNTAREKRLWMRSGFADIDYRSKTDYRTVASQVTEMMHRYLPSLEPVDRERRVSATAAVDDYSVLGINVKQANRVAGIFAPGLLISEGSSLNFMLNPVTQDASFNAKSEFIEYRNNFISGLDINARTEGDSVSVYLMTEDIYLGGLYMPDFTLNGSLKENKITGTMSFDEGPNGRSAILGGTAYLGRTDEGMPRTRIYLSPSEFRSGFNTWNISSRGIVIDTARIEIRGIYVEGDGQLLSVSGVVSDSRADTLSLRIRDFDITPLTGFAQNLGVSVSGKVNGHADLSSAKKHQLLEAELRFDDVDANGIEAPSTVFTSVWDFQRERAGMMLQNIENGDTIVVGYYRPTDGQYLARAKLRGLNLALLDPFVENVINGTSGTADADLTVTGPGRQVKINGDIRISDLGTTVDYLNVRYALDTATLKMTNNVISGEKALMRDQENNRAEIDLMVDLNNLKNIRYNFDITPMGLLVMNTSAKDNDIFYGHVYADGQASISGSRAGVKMDINATTASNSSFTMPIGGSTVLGASDVIRFLPPRRIQRDTSDIEVRKSLIRNRRTRRARNAGDGSLDIDMVVSVLPNTEFQLLIDPGFGDIIKGRGNGSLTMNVKPKSDGEFTMSGDYELTEGSYTLTLQGLLRKTFHIEPGSSIRWAGDPLDAVLDISAVYNLRGVSLTPLLGADQTYSRTVPVDCRIMITEGLMEPKFTFDITFPSTDPELQNIMANLLNTEEEKARQFFFLLATNNFTDDSGTGQGNIGSAVGSATAFDFLTNQISNWISSDKYNIGLRYIPRTDNTSEVFNVDFATSFANNRIIFEAVGNYDSGNNPTASVRNTANLSGDFYLTWVIDETGNLRLKGFSRTIDRFNENQGLQENGLGIYYTEDFNNFQDIVRNFRQRFSGGKRKEKRRLKKQLKEAAEPGEIWVRVPREWMVPPAGYVPDPQLEWVTGDGRVPEPDSLTETTPAGWEQREN